MKKKIKEEHWLMLPTDAKTELEVRSSIEETKFQYIYLTSDDKIQPKDWRVEYDVHGKFISVNNTSTLVGKYDRKIIATTDDLVIKQYWLGSKSFQMDYMSEIPQTLIDYYTKKQGRIGDIEVEFTNRCCGRCDGVSDDCVTDLTCKPHKVRGCEDCYGLAGDLLKLTEDNEIIVHIPKEEEKEKQEKTYTEKEMIGFAFHAVQECGEMEDQEVEDWIKENI